MFVKGQNSANKDRVETLQSVLVFMAIYLNGKFQGNMEIDSGQKCLSKGNNCK